MSVRAAGVGLVVLWSLALAPSRAVAADESVCLQLRERGYEACYRQNDAARAECADHCAHCGQLLVGCFSYCEHFCDASYPEGCGFDLPACVSRCNHHCHDPACDENPGCRAAWCNKEAVKACGDTCQATYASLATCRGSWCGGGKARKSCLDGCNGGDRALDDSCRKSWCGDGKAGRECYREADDNEEQCRKQTDAQYRACLAPAKK